MMRYVFTTSFVSFIFVHAHNFMFRIGQGVITCHIFREYAASAKTNVEII